jgi:uncharacterized membrane protein
VLPAHLHWFKWEAYWTWLSGFFLLCVMYYAGAEVYLIDKRVADLDKTSAIAIGIGALAAGWIVYDRLCESPLGRHERVFGAVMALLLGAAAWGLCQVFSGRGAFIHFGALLGTIMVANVFFVIIPGQRELVEAKLQNREPDPRHGLRGKQRSVHNTYFTLPVLFAMISNHYPMATQHSYNWAILVALSLASAGIRVYFVARHHGRASPLPALAGVLVLAGVAVAIAPRNLSSPDAAGGKVSFAQAQVIIAARCVACHADKPSQPGFDAPPKGVMLDTPERIAAQAPQIRQQVATRAMPIGNLTQMTDEERAVIAAWVDRHAAK